MIWIFLFFNYFFFSLKDFIFFNFFLFMESASFFMNSVICVAMLIVFFFFFNYLGLNEYLMYYYFFFLIMKFLFLLFFCNFCFYFLLFLELCVYPMSFLIIKFSKDSDKFLSVIFMFSINIMGSIPFMMFCLEIWNNQFLNSMMFLPFGIEICQNYLIFFFFFLILVSKLPLVFFHFWLTKAHVSASGSCSMILASLMLKLGSFGFYKFFLFFIFCSSIFINVMLSISIFGCIFFCFIMFRFFDLKYLIACSSILHMSLIFPLLNHGTSEGLIGSMLMMVGHGVVSYYLFFLATVLYEFTLNRSIDFNKSLESFSKICLMVLFFFFFLNMGFPPFINFYSELLFCLSLLNVSYFSAVMFSLSMILSILFTMYLCSKILFGKKFIYILVDEGLSLNFFNFKIFFMVVILPFLF